MGWIIYVEEEKNYMLFTRKIPDCTEYVSQSFHIMCLVSYEVRVISSNVSIFWFLSIVMLQKNVKLLKNAKFIIVL